MLTKTFTTKNTVSGTGICIGTDALPNLPKVTYLKDRFICPDRNGIV